MYQLHQLLPCMQTLTHMCTYLAVIKEPSHTHTRPFLPLIIDALWHQTVMRRPKQSTLITI